MARVNHKKVKQLIQERRGKISDREFFTSRMLALHFEDIAAAQTKRYGSRRPVRVHLTWEPDASHAACTNNLTIHINAGNPIITQFPTREERYQMVLGLFAHELGHCLYTDFLASQTYGQEISACRWYPEPPTLPTVKDRVNEGALWDYAQAEPENLPLLARVAHEVGNVLEDASIENRILEVFPGTLGQSLDFLREWQWNDMPTVTLLKEREAQGQPVFFSLLQLFLSYVKFGELKYGEEPFTEEHIRTVFELLPELDEDLQSRSGKERWKTVNTILIRCWEQVREYVEAIKRQHQEDKAAGKGVSVFSRLEQELSSLTGGSARGKGDTAPISGGPGPGSLSARREKTQALAKQAGEGEAASPKGAALSMGTAELSEETGEEDSSKQEVTAQEKGRMPLVKTDAISQPMGGWVERNNSYAPELSKTVEAEMERLLTHMAEQEVCQELEENWLSELNEFAKGISYGNAHRAPCIESKGIAGDGHRKDCRRGIFDAGAILVRVVPGNGSALFAEPGELPVRRVSV